MEALQSLSQKSEIFASSLYTREPLFCSKIAQKIHLLLLTTGAVFIILTFV